MDRERQGRDENDPKLTVHMRLTDAASCRRGPAVDAKSDCVCIAAPGPRSSEHQLSQTTGQFHGHPPRRRRFGEAISIPVIEARGNNHADFSSA